MIAWITTETGTWGTGKLIYVAGSDVPDDFSDWSDWRTRSIRHRV